MLNGKNIANKKPRQITEAGVSHIPEDRQRYGLELDMTLAENMPCKRIISDHFQSVVS